MKTITQAQRQQFKDSGVLHLPQLLDDASLQLARAAYEWSLSNPGRGATNLTQGAPGTFYGDLANPKCFPAYEAVNNKTILPQIISQLWDKPEVWFLYEQVFLKVGDVNEMAKRTPWHQDLPYLPIEGMDLAVAWISLESLDKQASLEFVVGSGQIIKGLDVAIPGMVVGDKKDVNVPCDQAYGQKNPDARQAVPREQIPAEIPVEVGTQLQMQTPQGQVVPVTVAEVSETEVTLDANHPLAGQDLNFAIEVVGIDAA